MRNHSIFIIFFPHPIYTQFSVWWLAAPKQNLFGWDEIECSSIWLCYHAIMSRLFMRVKSCMEGKILLSFEHNDEDEDEDDDEQE